MRRALVVVCLLLAGCTGSSGPGVPAGSGKVGGMGQSYYAWSQWFMGVVNPLLQQHVNWFWFIVSQFIFGLAMSYVVQRSEKIAVSQAPPLKSVRGI